MPVLHPANPLATPTFRGHAPPLSAPSMALSSASLSRPRPPPRRSRHRLPRPDVVFLVLPRLLCPPAVRAPASHPQAVLLALPRLQPPRTAVPPLRNKLRRRAIFRRSSTSSPAPRLPPRRAGPGGAPPSRIALLPRLLRLEPPPLCFGRERNPDALHRLDPCRPGLHRAIAGVPSCTKPSLHPLLQGDERLARALTPSSTSAKSRSIPCFPASKEPGALTATRPTSPRPTSPRRLQLPPLHRTAQGHLVSSPSSSAH